MKADADTIREHLKEFYGFKDEYNQRYKKEQKLIKYVYRLSHPAVTPYLHILRDADKHILALDLIYKDAVKAIVGANNTIITKNSNFDKYSIPPEYVSTKPLKGKPSYPAIRFDLHNIDQLERIMDLIFGLKPIKGN